MAQRRKGRTQLFVHNAFSTALYQILLMAYGILVPRAMLANYGSEINGLVSSINQVIAYISLVEAGLAGAAVYSLYKPLSGDDWPTVSSVVCATRNFYYRAGGAFTALIAGAAVAYPALRGVASLSFLQECLLIFVLGAQGFLEFFTLAKYRALLAADQRTYVISHASSVQIVIASVAVSILAAMRLNVVIVYLVAMSSFLARTLIMVVYSKKHYRHLDMRAVPDNRALDKRWDAFYLQILQSAQMGFPILLLTVMSSLHQVSVFSIYNMVFVGINGLLYIFVNGLSASFGDVIVRGNTRLLQEVTVEFETAYYALLCVAASVTMAMLMPFVRLYTSGIADAGSYDLPLLGLLMTVNCFLNNLKAPQGMLVIAAGLFRQTRWQSTAQAMIIVVFGIALVPFIGLYGVVIASILSNAYRCVDLVFYIPREVTKDRSTRGLRAMGWACLVFVLCCALFWVLPFPEPRHLWAWVGIAAVDTLIALSVVGALFFAYDRKTVKMLSGRIMRLLHPGRKTEA